MKVTSATPDWSTKPAEADPLVPSMTGEAPGRARRVVLPLPGKFQRLTVSSYVPVANHTVSPRESPARAALTVWNGLDCEPSPPDAAEASTYQSVATTVRATKSRAKLRNPAVALLMAPR